MIDVSQIFIVSHRSLRLLAALVWYGGFVALCFKASQLLVQAQALMPEEDWTWVAVIGGLVVGALKGELLFKRSCQKNLVRISTLVRPRLWQFFRPRFLLFMAIMIVLGTTLSRLAQNNHPFLIVVAFIDISIAVALLWGSRHFWK